MGTNGDVSGILRVMAAELDRLRSAQESKPSSMDSKAAALIAGAGIFVGLLSGGRVAGPTKVGVVLALLAAVCGVLALGPRRGKGVQLRGEREDWVGLDPLEVEFALFVSKRTAHDGDVARLGLAGWCVRIGFSSFAAAIAAIVVSAFL